ncbi:LPS export ABC transporter periplasmic protein LptC [Kiritimatiellaeota bacterium B1221]|nr:LPS export ABC transporter periplasmic protein LptC [Kiritimatiellaeota bacterium B1221]
MLLLSAVRLGAQTDVGKFKVPDIDENGVMVSLMTGESARMYPQKPMEITRLTMEFYEEDGETVKLKITSPFCNYDSRTNSATSEEKVKIEGPQYTITGEGYVFEATYSRLEIQNNVKVLLKNLNLKTAHSGKVTP